MAVKPIAGAARIAPAITPFSTSCAMSVSTPALRNLEELEGPALNLVVAKLAIGNVADVGEGTRPAGARVIDLLALLQHRQPIDGRIDLRAFAVGDRAHAVADRGAVRIARFRDRQ